MLIDIVLRDIFCVNLLNIFRRYFFYVNFYNNDRVFFVLIEIIDKVLDVYFGKWSFIY